MPQPRSSSGASRSPARKPAAKAKAAPKRAAAKAKASKAAPKRKAAAATRKPAATARKPVAAAKRKAQTAKRKPAVKRAASTADPLRVNLDALREALARGVGAPFDLVLTTRERMQETLDDAVDRGRITRDDAASLVSDLLRRGRKQTEDTLAELEALITRARGDFESTAADARKTTTKRASAAASKARKRPEVDRVVREVDKARRQVGLGPSFPILGYDDLTASQVNDRVTELTLPQLRKVRDYERRNANRKSVLDSLERRLA